MPVDCVKRGGKYRLVETSTGLVARGDDGKVLDKGGCSMLEYCRRIKGGVNHARKQAQNPLTHER